MLMLTIRLVLLSIFFQHFVAANPITSAEEQCQKKLAECTIEDKSEPVCGSDGVTYPSQCQVISKQCQGESILIKHTGPCPEMPACFSARLSSRSRVRPVCRPDGTFAPVQCHMETGFCWCVTLQGRPLPNTSVRHQRPRCEKLALRSAIATKSGHKRRSSNLKENGHYNNTKRNACGRLEKTKFNNNLIDNFRIEYKRTNISANGDKNVERVLSWKFSTLDLNGDGYLDRTEYKELRKVAKQVVKPKRCARTFARTCDIDRDLRLSKQEWGTCLSNDFTLRLFLSLNSAADPREVPEDQRTQATDKVLKGNASPTDTRTTYSDNPADTKEENDATDCLSDRLSVMEDQRNNSQEKFYIPQCTPDGRYEQVQCYSGYCWCVYQDTGKPIPGTSSKDTKPNCDPAPTPSRPIKGCPEIKKQIFLRNLMDVLKKKMKDSNSSEITANWQASKEEQIATWHFVMLDKNKNKVLERKEWKSFRIMVSNNKLLRKCGKRLPRYCDINNDRKISMTEWLSCLSTQPVATAESSENSSTNKPKRMGPNPLDQFLNDDD